MAFQRTFLHTHIVCLYHSWSFTIVQEKDKSDRKYKFHIANDLLMLTPDFALQTAGAPIAKAELLKPSSCFMVPFSIGQSLKEQLMKLAMSEVWRCGDEKNRVRKEMKSRKVDFESYQLD